MLPPLVYKTDLHMSLCPPCPPPYGEVPLLLSGLPCALAFSLLLRAAPLQLTILSTLSFPRVSLLFKQALPLPSLPFWSPFFFSCSQGNFYTRFFWFPASIFHFSQLSAASIHAAPLKLHAGVCGKLRAVKSSGHISALM